MGGRAPRVAVVGHIEWVDFLWLDMQGYEPLALQFAATLLPNVRAILTEVNIVEMYAGAMLYPAYQSFLKSKGFQVEQEHIPPERDGSGGVAFFVRR